MISYTRIKFKDIPTEIYNRRLYKVSNGVLSDSNWFSVGRYFNVYKDNSLLCAIYWHKQKRCWKVALRELYHINRDALIVKFILYMSNK